MLIDSSLRNQSPLNQPDPDQQNPDLKDSDPEDSHPGYRDQTEISRINSPQSRSPRAQKKGTKKGAPKARRQKEMVGFSNNAEIRDRACTNPVSLGSNWV
jgi:hypothetical protein